MIENQRKDYPSGFNCFCVYHSVDNCCFEAKELKEKYLSSSDWYFSRQLNN